MKTKAQVSSFDLIVSIVIFVFIFISMREIWLANTTNFDNELRFNEMRLKGQQALDVMVKTSGYPEQWTEADVEIIGLASNPNVLDNAKVSEFSSMDYNKALEKLWLGSYEFCFELFGSGDLNIGNCTPSSVSTVSISRVVLYKGGEASVVFKVFKE